MPPKRGLLDAPDEGTTFTNARSARRRRRDRWTVKRMSGCPPTAH